MKRTGLWLAPPLLMLAACGQAPDDPSAAGADEAAQLNRDAAALDANTADPATTDDPTPSNDQDQP